MFVLNEEELVIKKKYDELFNKFKEVTDNEKIRSNCSWWASHSWYRKT